MALWLCAQPQLVHFDGCITSINLDLLKPWFSVCRVKGCVYFIIVSLRAYSSESTSAPNIHIVNVSAQFCFIRNVRLISKINFCA